MIKKQKIYITGIHCRACKILLETEIKNIKGVNNVHVDHQNGECELEYNEDTISQEMIFSKIEELNYQPSINTTKDKKNKIFFLLSGVAIFLLASGYFVVDSLGGFELLAELNESSVSYGLILIIGLLAGFHCVGMCGGLVVAYSANQKEKKKNLNISSHLEYNLARIISYSIIGGILGGIGSFFGINPSFTGSVTIIASIFMILMGLSFVTNWPILEKIKFYTPDFIARYIYQQKHGKKSKGPFIIGLLTGFMPCGPLQAIQLYALTSGDIAHGALSMGVYGLGTSLMMLIFGLTVSSISGQNMSKIVKISGVLVIGLGILMMNRGLANFNLGLNFSTSDPRIIVEKNSKDEYQEIKMELNSFGYKPNVLYLKKDMPVRWIIDVKQMSGCTNAIMIESLGIKKDLKYGENVIEFNIPANVSEIKFSCWMRMVWGKFIIADNSTSKNTPQAQAAFSEPSAGCGGSCGSPSCGATQESACGCGN